MDKFNWNFEGSVDQPAASNEIVMDVDSVDSVDFNSELRQIEKEIDRHKPTLQSSRDERENVETEICDTRQLQRKAQFVLDNVRLEEENLHEHFKKIHLNHEECKERSSANKEPTETIRARMSELAAQRKELLEELTRLRKNVDDNEKKLARVKAMLAEQEKKNATNVRELKEISESGIFISPDIKKQLDAVLANHELNKSDDAINNTMQ